MMPLQTKWSEIFCKEPFRLLFPLGILLGCAGVSHWLFYDLGWIANPSRIIHGAIQIQCFLMAFAAGFLLTALPRFMGVKAPTRTELFLRTICLCAGAAMLLAGQLLGGYLMFVLAIAGILLFAARRFGHRANTPPKEFVFVPFGLAHGLLGAVFQMISWAIAGGFFLNSLGWLMMTQGMFLCLIMGIGGFLAPRLMGHETLPIVTLGEGGLRGARIGVGIPPPIRVGVRIPLHIGAALVLLGSFVLEASGRAFAGKLLRAAVVTAELLATTQCYKKPSVKDRYIFFLWISLGMVILGLWVQVLLPLYRVAALHILFIGGFSLMTLSIATRVTMSHLGFGHLLDKPLWAVSQFGVLFLMATALRFAADYHQRWYFHVLSIAAFLWLGGALAWLAFVLPKIFRATAGA